MVAQQRLFNARILIVDDQQPNVMLLERMLKDSGYVHVQTATDSREVARLYQEFQPDLLLLDLRMPFMDGFEVMEQLRRMNPDDYLPILMLTTDFKRENRLRALTLGARDFVGKPFDYVEVLSRIQNLLEVRLLHNEVRDQNRMLEEKVRERTRELRETQLEIVLRLARTTEYRDNDTGFHITRMSLYCHSLGCAAGMSEEECELLRHSSPMHDVGKVAIPDHILHKPGKLDPDEWEIMKTHAAIGANILSGSRSELLQMAEEIALTHHEKWDGTGYPNGLKGEEIPLVGRICGLCDVFDALTSERPYKKAWSVEEAVTEIQRGSGKHFDPRLVERFMQILPEIIEIKERYAESAQSTQWLHPSAPLNGDGARSRDHAPSGRDEKVSAQLPADNLRSNAIVPALSNG